MRNQSCVAVLIVLAGLAGCGTVRPTGPVPGIRLTYQLDTSKLTTSQLARLPDLRMQELNVLKKRAERLDPMRATVTEKGTDEIVVELTGVTSIAAARKALGAVGKLQMFHATTLLTEQHNTRPYSARTSDNPDDPSVDLIENGTGKAIRFGDLKYAKIVAGWNLILEGNDIEHAAAQPAGDNYYPLMHFSLAGTSKMTAWCDKYLNTGENLATVFDGRILEVAPLKNGGRITSDAEIEGAFTPAYVRRLVDVLNAGSLPVPLKEVGDEIVETAPLP